MIACCNPRHAFPRAIVIAVCLPALMMLSGGPPSVRGEADAAPASVAEAVPGEDWPQFRGPGAQGVAIASDLPVRWNEKLNVRWKTRIPGLGWSSPVIRGGQIWMTTAVDEGHSLRAVCVDEASGKILTDVEVFRKAEPGKIHPKNSHATPTPLLEGDHVFVHFGAHGTACLDRQGKIVWTAELPYFHHHGPSASPVLAAGRLVIPCDGFFGPFYDRVSRPNVEMAQFVAALDPGAGTVLWKKPRDGLHSYATPLVIEVNGTTQVICPGGKRVVAYDPSNGAELWWVRYGNGYSVVPRPVFGHGHVYVCTGYDAASLLAIRPDGSGDVTKTHVTWSISKGVPFNPSPLLDGEQLYFVSDSGVATCVDAGQGTVRWQGRLGGNFSASPILAGGQLYFCSETGVTSVVEPGPSAFKRLASNKLDGRIFASPAVADGAIFLRTDRSLYRIESSGEEAPVTPSMP